MKTKQFILSLALFIGIDVLSQKQPEHYTFEPIGTTDLVNLSTGDFTYNLPVLNIPGSNGGFSLPLFYHAGTRLEQEATWVGLGWNINPGVIVRDIVGIPDGKIGVLWIRSIVKIIQVGV